MDRGCRRDPHQTGAQTENRSPGCRAATATPDRRPLSTNLGSGRGKSGSAATALRHRHRMVQMRTRIMNQLHVLALNEGVRRKKAAAMRTSHCPAEGATTWPRTRTVRGNTPATSSATTSTAKPDLNEWVRAA